jgi:hypothetical protein
MNTEDDYFQFLYLLTEDRDLSKKTAAKLIQCDNDPGAFFKQYHESYFGNRGLERGKDNLTYYFMLDVLIESKHAFELDWKADIESLNHAVSVMSMGKLFNIVTQEEGADADSMYDLLDIAEEYLQEHNQCLLMLPMDGDSYPVALIPINKQKSLDDMMDELFKNV